VTLARALLALAAVALSAAAAGAGHEITFYPAYYPQEIAVRFAEPAAAAALLRQNKLHAYAGGDPFAAGATPPPPNIHWAESLRGFVVLTFPRAAGAFAEPEARCAAGAALARALGGRAGLVAHPYPITPYHDDYVFHADLVQRARERAADTLPRVSAGGALGAALAAAGVPRAGAGADAALEAVELPALLAAAETRSLGWLGPPWLKEGWFHTWLLQSGAAARKAAEEPFRRRTEGGFASAAERLTLERRIVTQASAGCERVVVGYTLRREPLNGDYNEGVENVAADAQAGLASPIFVRTVKLKDFPWNGWLRVGAPAPPPRAGWNPVAGFGDVAGRLVWAAVGDPALLPDPDSGRFVPNRARPLSVSEAGEVPADALLPATLRPAGPGVAARTKVVYRVLLSNAHDGVRLGVADVLYPYAFAARWGADGGSGREHDPEVERAGALARRTLAAVRVTGVAKEVKELGDMQLMYDVPQVEVYLKPALDTPTAAAIAPPWSPVPWPVLALMEQAVVRGVGAFSERAAQRRGVPWLDLVRDGRQRAALGTLAAELERTAWVPEALRPLVPPAEAKRRWAALREFARKQGHFLATAGPYVMGKGTAEGVTLAVFRDFSYPLGVGSFDQYPIPLRAHVVKVERRGERLEIQADVENIEKFGRSYKIVREPFRPQPASEKTREPLTVHWAVVGGHDEVAAAGASHDVQNGRLVVDLAGRLRPGAYRVLLAPALNGNLVNPEVRVLPYRLPE
jgi:hypothetical protein